MNWIDYVVIGLIAVFAIAGVKKGIVMSVFRIVSFFVSIYASVKLSPVFAGILGKTPVYTWIRDSVVNRLLQFGKEASAASAAPISGTAGAEAVINPFPLPEFFKSFIVDKLPDASKLVDMQGIINSIGDEITKMIISLISLIVLYLIFNTVLTIIGLVLKGVLKLPLLKQTDKLGGLAFGVVEGILAIYVICAILVLFNASPLFSNVFKGLDSSLFAGYFYEHNFIINWLFPNKVV